MPEFKRSFPAFAHIGPIFIRTIAIMFVQAGLLRPNHPSMMYGLARDVPKFKFSDLMGEAWYNLRVNEGNTPYQYGMFIGVIMMICLSIVSAFFFVTTLFLSSAQAQIFDHPTVDTSVTAATASSGGIFQMNSSSPDLAIDLLNKVIRQSAYGEGAPMSVALGPLMGVYNTALLVIASLVVFWAILSIVIDTARTGQIGGGRHSIVWVPIRFVFALGLMIPLGTGFSGGQLITLKIAEWGSNLATNGWIAYVGGVNDASLVALQTPGREIGARLAYSLARIETCRNTYNGLATQAGVTSIDELIHYQYGALFAPERNVIQAPAAGTWGNVDKKHLYVGNDSVKDYCGTIIIQNPNARTLGPVRGFEQLQTAVLEAGTRAKQAHYNAFFNYIPQVAERIGCGLSHEYNNISPAYCSSFDTAYDDGNFPKADLIETAAERYHTAVDAQSQAAYQIMVDYVTNNAFIEEMKAMGWAGMGVWYFKIQQMNTALDAITAPVISIEQGPIALEAEEGFFANLFKDKEIDEVQAKTFETMTKFDDWWLSESTDVAPDSVVGRLGLKNVRTGSPQQNSSGGSSEFDNVIDDVFSDWTWIEFDEDSYPMTALMSIGSWMLGLAMAGYVAVAVLSVVFGTKVAGTGPGTDLLITGPVGELVGTLLTVMLGAGLFLKYYIPLIPWIRVLFAVLSWVISVFEAVVIVPLLALANLSTDGEGLFTQTGRNLWISSLQVLMRPIMTVIGFVAALLIFNAVVTYVNQTYNMAISLADNAGGISGLGGILSFVVYSIIYVVIVYSLINSTFKIMDELPNATMKWMGGPQDISFNDSNMEGYVIAAARGGEKIGGGLMGGASGKAGQRQSARDRINQEDMAAEMRKGPNGSGGAES